jgi:hypothetical protein
MPDGTTFRHSSLTIASKEFETFLGQKKENTKMLVLLTDLYDCEELPWQYRTKHSGSNIIPSVFLNLLAATTPSSLASQLPASAIGGGLTTRMLFPWADRKYKKVPRPSENEEEKKLKELLVKDLYLISRMNGTFEMSSDCENKWDKWYNGYEEKDPNRFCKDPTFDGWYSRKPTYMLKVAMCCSSAESSSLIMEWRYIEQAKKYIEEVEVVMEKSFAAVGMSLLTQETDMVMTIIQSKGWIREKELMSMIWRDVDATKFITVMDTIIISGKIQRSYKGPKGELGDIWYKWIK